MVSSKHGKWIIRLSSLLVLLIGSTAYSQKKSLLVPDAAVGQYAGSIGYLSAGISYDIFGNDRGSIDILYGFVPPSKGGDLDILTAKFSYRPFVIPLKKALVIYPLNPGAFFTYTVDDQLSFSWDREQYGKSYYGWSEAFRSHLSLSSEVEIKGEKIYQNAFLKSLVLYSEVNATDLYLVSWAQNASALSLTDIFKLGLGVKVKF